MIISTVLATPVVCYLLQAFMPQRHDECALGTSLAGIVRPGVAYKGPLGALIWATALSFDTKGRVAPGHCGMEDTRWPPAHLEEQRLPGVR